MNLLDQKEVSSPSIGLYPSKDASDVMCLSEGDGLTPFGNEVE